MRVAGQHDGRPHGPREALRSHALSADGVVWGALSGIGDEALLTAQVRAHGAAEPALARQTGPEALEVVFEAPRTAVAPGQAVVLYDGDTVAAGGWIASADAAPADDGASVALPTL